MAIIDKLLPAQMQDADLNKKHQTLEDILAKEHTALSIAAPPILCAGCPHNSSTICPGDARLCWYWLPLASPVYGSRG